VERQYLAVRARSRPPTGRRTPRPPVRGQAFRRLRYPSSTSTARCGPVTKLVVFVGTFDQSDMRAVGAAYDPVARTWRLLGASPVVRGGFDRPVWDGRRVLLLSLQSEMVDGGEVNPFPEPLSPTGAYTRRPTAGRRCRSRHETGVAADPSSGPASRRCSGAAIHSAAWHSTCQESLGTTAEARRARPGISHGSLVGHRSAGLGRAQPAAVPDGSHGDGPLRPLRDGVALTLGG
jgi:hypothetical protein